MDYQKIIKSSNLKFSIKRISVQLITNWFACTKIKYDISNVANFVIDELEVENDFVDHLSSAIDSLINNKSWKKRTIPGWSFGYLCGHIQGALNSKWINQYLIEPSKEFEDLMKIKAILEILRIDSDVSRKLEIIYDYFISHKKQAVDKDEKLPSNVVSLIQRGKLINTRREKYRKEFHDYFEDILKSNYMSLIQTYDFMCCPDLTKYLDEHEVVNIVGKKHFA